MKSRTFISDKNLHIDPEQSGGLHLFSCHNDHVLAGTKIRFHEHPYWEFAFMLSGSMMTYCDEVKIPCRENEYEIFLAPAGTIHRRLFGENENNCNLTCIFTLADLTVSRALADKCVENGYHFTVSGFSAALMRELRSKYFEHSVISNQIIALLAEALLLEFIQCYGKLPETGTYDHLFWNKMTNQEKADEIRGFLLSHIDSPDINDRLCGQFKLSLRQLNRIFQQKWNCSISEAMNAIKLEQSGILLRNTEMTIHEIASRMGFISRAGFYNFFKKHKGMTPAEFRNAREPLEKTE